tara:strand:+ start:318 stop:512 length:195 start_codon:yes stop_codon:yes gene_type:complete
LKVQVFNFNDKMWEEKDVDIDEEMLIEEEEIVKNLDEGGLIQYHHSWINIINTINIMESEKYNG